MFLLWQANSIFSQYLQNGITNNTGDAAYSGNLTIGTPSLSKLFMVNGSINCTSGMSIYGAGLDGTILNQRLVIASNSTMGNYFDAAQNASGKMPVYFKWRGDAFASSAMTILGNGNVGIGTTTPKAPLEIYGAGPYPCDIISCTESRAIRFYPDKEGHENGNLMNWPTIEIDSKVGLQIIDKANGYPVMLRIGEIQGWSGTTYNGYVNCAYEIGAQHFSLRDQTGNHQGVEFNTTTGNFQFGGKITCKEIEVKANVWADCVFKKEYKLRSLAETETFIKTNSHLPEVPTEQEATEKGINIGNMNATLLKKIEELTLYAIQQQKEIEALKTEVQQMKK